MLVSPSFVTPVFIKNPADIIQAADKSNPVNPCFKINPKIIIENDPKKNINLTKTFLLLIYPIISILYTNNTYSYSLCSLCPALQANANIEIVTTSAVTITISTPYSL